jgi:hypothetical protein
MQEVHKKRNQQILKVRSIWNCLYIMAATATATISIRPMDSATLWPTLCPSINTFYSHTLTAPFYRLDFLLFLATPRII